MATFCDMPRAPRSQTAVVWHDEVLLQSKAAAALQRLANLTAIVVESPSAARWIGAGETTFKAVGRFLDDDANLYYEPPFSPRWTVTGEVQRAALPEIDCEW